MKSGVGREFEVGICCGSMLQYLVGPVPSVVIAIQLLFAELASVHPR